MTQLPLFPSGHRISDLMAKVEKLYELSKQIDADPLAQARTLAVLYILETAVSNLIIEVEQEIKETVTYTSATKHKRHSRPRGPQPQTRKIFELFQPGQSFLPEEIVGQVQQYDPARSESAVKSSLYRLAKAGWLQYDAESHFYTRPNGKPPSTSKKDKEKKKK